MDTQLETAKMLCREAHAGQVDKAGEPYHLHPERIASKASCDLARIVALLHDVVEDTAESFEDLTRRGFSDEIVRLIDALTRREGESASDYHARIRAAGPIAIEVKLLDIQDNSDPRRLARLDPEMQLRLIQKYAQSMHALLE